MNIWTHLKRVSNFRQEFLYLLWFWIRIEYEFYLTSSHHIIQYVSFFYFQTFYCWIRRSRFDLFLDLSELSSYRHHDDGADICSQGNSDRLENVLSIAVWNISFSLDPSQKAFFVLKIHESLEIILNNTFW